MNCCKKIIKCCLLASIGILLSFQTSFKASQQKNQRVKTAYTRHWGELQKLLSAKNINKDNFSVYIRVFKEEGLLEAWVKNKNQTSYTFLKKFAICAKSGKLGPKRKQGDGQVPEGFYEITSFQPQSSYHLALKVGYPNKSDRIKATSPDPGGDIMIHGNCVTIGCIPLQDEPVEELYILCVEAKNCGYSINADIYPFKFDSKNVAMLQSSSNEELKNFWLTLKKASNYFDETHRRAEISINSKGDYQITTN
jgi:murein L,D-transpeptidase YafK